MKRIEDLDREELLELLRVYAQNWLAHDGCWFLGIEEELGHETARRYNNKAWERYAPVEARRLIEFLGRKPGEGLDALAEALVLRQYASINRQEVLRADEGHLVFRMNECRVQATRKRKGLPDYACKEAGIIEFSGFARGVDPRIETRCIACPPDEHPADWWCAWEFTLPRG
jgi:hypothetical protein